MTKAPGAARSFYIGSDQNYRHETSCRSNRRSIIHLKIKNLLGSLAIRSFGTQTV